MGRIEAICVSDRKGVRKQPLPRATLLENHGIEGDCHAGPWHRQVSLLDVADIEWMRGRGLPNLKFGDFAENLAVSGVDLAGLGLGSRLRLGDEAEVVLTQLGKVCHARCAIYFQAGDCIMPRRGIFARVLRCGTIERGAPVEILAEVSRDTIQAVVLTISDKGSRGEREDTAGPAVARRLEEELGAHVYATEILPDKGELIEERLRHYAGGHSIDLVVTAGGTGFSPRDVTPEAVRNVVERFTPGLDEAMRLASAGKTSRAWLSRAVSGIRNRTLIVSLPGSERAATENIDAVLPALGHGLKKLRGDESDCATPSPE